MSCDPRVFANGYCIARLDVTRDRADALCATLNDACTDRVLFDWHYMGGWVMLLYLGDYEVAHDVLMSLFPYETSTGTVYGPGNKSMGQVLNAQPV